MTFLIGDNGTGKSTLVEAIASASGFKLIGCTGDLAKAEPQTLRYRIFTTPAGLTRSQRRRWLRPPATWPWATALVTAIARIRALPTPSPGEPSSAPDPTTRRNPRRTHHRR